LQTKLVRYFSHEPALRGLGGQIATRFCKLLEAGFEPAIVR
jgi:hypothetical protein